MSRYFKLKALNCTGKAGKVLHSRDNKIYTEDAFNDADAMVKNRHLIEVDKDGNPLAGTKKANENTAETGSDVLFSVVLDGEPTPVRSVDDLSKKQIISALESLDVEHDKAKNKETLFELLQEQFN